MYKRLREVLLGSQKLLFAAVTVWVLCVNASAGTFTAFGAKTYVRPTGDPVTVTDTFTVLNPNTQYTLRLTNGSLLDSATDLVSSTVVTVNGVTVVAPNDLNQNIASLDKAVQLQSTNTISVQVRGKPGGQLAIQIVGVDNDPPTIGILASPAADTALWNNTNVTVSFNCVDFTSGIASCTPPIVLGTEGAGQIITGTAVDLAANTASTSVTLNIDTTAPGITAVTSPAPIAGWNNTPVTVIFSCTDTLSGIDFCSGVQTVTSEGTNQVVSGSATDKAGNTSSTAVPINIDMTPPSVIVTSPTDGFTFTVANVSLAGTISDALSGVASVQCNGIAASVSSGTFLCQLTLNPGANAIQVLATDLAGNQSSAALNLTFQAMPPVPISAIFVTPTNANLLVNQTRSLSVVSDLGTPVAGASLSVSDPSVLQLSNGQITAVQPGTVTITATLGSLSANATVTVFSGTQLPQGTPFWSLTPLPGKSSWDGAIADGTTDGSPGIYWLEFSSGFSSFTARALTRDGQQLWYAPITVPAIQAAAATNTVAALSSMSSEPSSANLNESSGASDAGFTRRPAGMRTVESFLQDLASQGGKAAMRADLTARQLKPFLARRRSVEEFHSAALQKAKAHLAHLQAVQSTGVLDLGQPAAAGTISGTFQAASAFGAQASVLDALTGSYIALKEVPDSKGGLLILLLPLSCCQSPESLVRLDPDTQALSWRYDAPGIGSDFAVSDDGTIFLQAAVPSTAVPGVNQFATAFVGLDVQTGAPKFSHEVDGELAGHGGLFPLQPIAIQCFCIDAGPIMVGPDGNAHVTYSTSDATLTTENNGLLQTVTTTTTMNLLTLAPSGGSSTQVLKTYTGTDTITFDPDFNFITQVTVEAPFPRAAETIVDSSGNLLTAWRSDLGPSQTCTLTKESLTGLFDVQCTTTSPGMIQPEITLNGFDFDVPFTSWSPGIISNIDPGASLVLGQANTAFAFNGFQIASLQTDTGTSPWVKALPANLFPSTLIGGTADLGVLLNLITGPLSQYDASGNPTVSSFQFSFSDVDNLTNLLGTDAEGNAALLPLQTPLAASLWNPQANQKKRSAQGPAITSLTKDRALVGVSTKVALKGSRLDKVTRVDMGDGITVTLDPIVQTSAVLGLNLAIAPDAPTGAHKVTLFVSKQSFPQKQTFFVQIPSSVARADFPNVPGGVGPLITLTDGPILQLDGSSLAQHQCGVYRNYTFQLVDQDSPPQPIKEAYVATEKLTYSPACTQNAINQGKCPSELAASSNSTGIVGDTQSISATVPDCLGSNESLVVNQGFSITIGGKAYDLSTVIQITKGNFNGVLKVDSVILKP